MARKNLATASSEMTGQLLYFLVLVILLTSGYFLWDSLIWFVKGPGNYSRMFAALVVIANLKSLPFAWSVRVLGAYITHLYLFRPSKHTPDKLFRFVISQSHVPLLDIDYNMHKSNATFFTDLDVSRGHTMHLIAPAIHKLWNNAKTKLVMDPSNPTRPVKGSVNVIVGAVQTSFKKELRAYARYEIWTRVLSWDRKWVYVITYFVKHGVVKPRSWDTPSRWSSSCRSTPSKPEDWENYILAVSLTKTVFKMGRLTIHPAIILGESGLLPPRPGGWIVGDDELSKSKRDILEDIEMTDDGAWDWRRVERERRKGLEYANHFAALDMLSKTFDGGENGAIGKFWLA